MKISRVSVIGLGKLGSPIVASLAARGYEVVGFDVNHASIAALAAHRAPVSETGLQELIDEHRGRISATSSLRDAVAQTDLSFVVVPTPSLPDGGFSNQFVLAACEAIGAALRAKKEFHVVVVASTVMPGASEGEIIPALERASGKKAGQGFGYCYSPSLIALGSVVRDFMNPELVMIGGGDPRSAEALKEFYGTVFLSKPVFHLVTPREAELAKLGLNAYVTMKISFANMLGMIADRMEKTNVDNVTKILGSDSRIGPKYLKAGGSYGGPCFPRDNRAFIQAAKAAGVATHLPQATDATNQQYIKHIAGKAKEALAAIGGTKIGIVGVAYKPGTEVVEEGMGLHLAKHFADQGIPSMVYDPAAGHAARNVLGDAVAHADSLHACLDYADAVIITNPYKEIFSNFDPAELRGKIVIDCWKILPEFIQDVPRVS